MGCTGDLSAEVGATKLVQAEAPSRPAVAPALAKTPLGKALQSMVSRDPTLASGLASENASLAKLNEARTALRPSLGLQVEAGASTGARAGLTPVLRLSQRVYDGGAARSRIAASQDRVKRARHATEAALAKRVFDAIGAWEELYTARDLEALAKRSVARHEKMAQLVDRRVKAGAGANAEALRAASRLADARARLASASGRRTEAETAASYFFGQMRHVGPLPPAPPPRTGLAANPDLLALRSERAAAGEDVRAVRAQRLPAVFLDLTGAAPSGGRATTGAALRLDYTFNTNGAASAASDAAKAKANQLDAQIALAREDLLRAARSAAGRELSIRSQLKSAEVSARTAQDALANAEAQFASGHIQIVDLLELGRDVDLADARRVELASAGRLSGYDRLLISGEILGVFGLCPDGCRQ
jgi:outer membrane protein